MKLVDDTPVTPGETREAYDGYEASKAYVLQAELLLGCIFVTNSPYSIIQDCEDALTNWVEQNAAVSSKLSTRARNLSQRRQKRIDGGGVDLAGQDQPMKDRESGLWVPANAHREYQDDGDEEEEEEEAANGETRGREEVRETVA